jgi:glycosyltransferase involved in cell wall biosynthesis
MSNLNNYRKYVIISPVRDEEAYIEKTIKSVLAQTILPAEWVIVNDGSSDKTESIIGRYGENYNWIKPRHRENRGFRKAGGGVIEAFYDGYNLLANKNWRFIVKLDGDLSFQSDYFERCFENFDANPKLGIGGGMIYHIVDGNLKAEPNPLFHVRGATKIYKSDCWSAIGGLIKAPGWDTIDEVKANMLGWQTRSFPDLRVMHYRYTGAEDGSWRNAVKNGRASYISGYHPLFIFAKCVRRLARKPYLIGSLGLFWGFISSYMKKIPQVDDPRLINYLRREQVKRLLLKSSIWE